MSPVVLEPGFSDGAVPSYQLTSHWTKVHKAIEEKNPKHNPINLSPRDEISTIQARCISPAGWMRFSRCERCVCLLFIWLLPGAVECTGDAGSDSHYRTVAHDPNGERLPVVS